jgi:hypothetical protein
MIVPEAPVEESYRVVFREDHVRCTGEVLPVKTIAESHDEKATTYLQLEIRVLGPDQGHDSTSGRFVNGIRHESVPPLPSHDLLSKNRKRLGNSAASGREDILEIVEPPARFAFTTSRLVICLDLYLPLSRITRPHPAAHIIHRPSRKAISVRPGRAIGPFSKDLP